MQYYLHDTFTENAAAAGRGLRTILLGMWAALCWPDTGDRIGIPVKAAILSADAKKLYCRLEVLSLTQKSAISRKYLGQICAASQTEAAAVHDAVPSHQRRKKGFSCYTSCFKTTPVL